MIQLDKICRAQNLGQGIIMKTSFKTRVLRLGLGSSVDINILVMKYLFLHILHFFRIYKMLRPKKRILKGFVERYSFKFLALSAQHAVYTIHPKPGATQQSEENIQGRLTFSETSEYPFSSGLHFY